MAYTEFAQLEINYVRQEYYNSSEFKGRKYITMEILERYTMAYTEFAQLEVSKAYAQEGLPDI